jgi:lipopolysaccharide/colanic/teichoic acid biosynthesis glycosyltransferase
MTRRALAFKRGGDILCAVCLLLLLAPLMLATAAAALAAQGRPLLFVDIRHGRRGEVVRVVKFRSMADGRHTGGTLLPDEMRTSRIGRIMRRFRFDELPSLLGVLRGDLSMVGPRPLPSHYPECRLGGHVRASVRPGLTGLAQVSGNTLLSPEEKVSIDLQYIATWTLRRDLVILLRTVAVLVGGERRDERLIAAALSQSRQKFGR